MNRKVILIGFDGFDPNLVQAWRKDLPTLSQLMSNGYYGILKSTVPPNTVPAWPCLYTGLTPDKIGIYAFRERKRNEYKWKYVNAKNVKGEPIWNVLSKHRIKNIIFNVPLTYPPTPINGVLATGLLTPSPKCNYTYPKDVKNKLKKEVANNYLFEPKDLYGKDIHLYASELVDIQKRAILFLMKKYEWDFFFGVFNSSDIVSHFYMEKPEYKSKKVKEIYIKLDIALSEILESIRKENYYLIIVSDHGFGYIKGTFNVNNWLAEKGYLKIKDKSSTITAKKLYMGIKKLGLPDFILSRLSKVDKSFINKFIPIEDNDIFSGIVDWKKTKAYCTDMGLIYINERDREPMGIINCNQKTGVVNEIISELENCEYVSYVYKGADIYSNISYNTPDIVISTLENELNPSAYICDDTITKHPKWSGAHRSDGFYLIHGYNINKNRIKITDIYGIILDIFGVNIERSHEAKKLNKNIKNIKERVAL